MFKLQDDFTYRWPVKVQVPSLTTPGKFEIFQFIAHFEAWTKEDAEAFDKALKAQFDAEAPGPTVDPDEILKTVLKGWDDVFGPDEKPVEFNEATRDLMLSKPWNRIALYEAWNASVDPKARRAGN